MPGLSESEVREMAGITHVGMWMNKLYLVALKHWNDQALETSLKWHSEPIHRCWALTWRLPAFVVECSCRSSARFFGVRSAGGPLQFTVSCANAPIAPSELDRIFAKKCIHTLKKYIYNKGFLSQTTCRNQPMDCLVWFFFEIICLISFVQFKHAGCSFKKMYDQTGSVSREKTKSNSYIYITTPQVVVCTQVQPTGPSRLHAVPPPPQQVTPADIDKQPERWREEQWRSKSLKRHQRWRWFRHGSGGFASSVEAAMARRRSTRMLPLSLGKSW